MKLIDFDRAINKCQERNCIIQGKGVDLFQGMEDIDLELLRDKVPLPFSEINEIIQRNFCHIGYIDFWSQTKIYEC